MAPLNLKLIKYKIALIKTINDIKKVQRRRYWVHPIWETRKKEGQYQTLIKSLSNLDPEFFKKYLRVTPEEFNIIKNLVKNDIKKIPKGRKALSVGFRLGITLRFLATGDSLSSLSFAFRIGFSTAHYIIKDTCWAIWKNLQPLYLKEPTLASLKEVAKGYKDKWNFPHCVGSVDGKHVAIVCPPKSGTMYYNYKGFFSIVLMGTVDHDYKFISVNIGGYGSQADSGIFKESQFYKNIVSGKTNLPPDEPLPLSNIEAPHVLIADEAFQLQNFMLRPFPGLQLTKERRIYNYRLSRARRCVENAFGIMSSRFQIFLRSIKLHPENCDLVIKACVVLHNFLRTMSLKNGSSFYCPNGYEDIVNQEGSIVEGDWRSNQITLVNVAPSQARNYSTTAMDVRNKFVQYFNSQEGSVAWQYSIPGI